MIKQKDTEGDIDEYSLDELNEMCNAKMKLLEKRRRLLATVEQTLEQEKLLSPTDNQPDVEMK